MAVHLWSALAQTRDKTFNTRTYAIDIVDQVGRGDSFAAGFLYGYIATGDVQKALDYGVCFCGPETQFSGRFQLVYQRGSRSPAGRHQAWGKPIKKGFSPPWCDMTDFLLYTVVDLNNVLSSRFLQC